MENQERTDLVWSMILDSHREIVDAAARTGMDPERDRLAREAFKREARARRKRQIQYPGGRILQRRKKRQEKNQ